MEGQMKKVKKYIHHTISRGAKKAHAIVNDISGEGFVDTAVIS
jgi:hypothetical protein